MHVTWAEQMVTVFQSGQIVCVYVSLASVVALCMCVYIDDGAEKWALCMCVFLTSMLVKRHS